MWYVITWQLGLGRQTHYLVECAAYLSAGMLTILGFPLAIIPWSLRLNVWGVIPNSLLWGAAIYQISKRSYRHRNLNRT